nr:MAG TPA: hypothetical protein [Caudoviricetes sp.]
MCCGYHEGPISGLYLLLRLLMISLLCATTCCT